MVKKLRVVIASALLLLLAVSYLVYRGSKKTEAMAVHITQPKASRYYQVRLNSKGPTLSSKGMRSNRTEPLGAVQKYTPKSQLQARSKKTLTTAAVNKDVRLNVRKSSVYSLQQGNTTTHKQTSRTLGVHTVQENVDPQPVKVDMDSSGLGLLTRTQTQQYNEYMPTDKSVILPWRHSKPIGEVVKQPWVYKLQTYLKTVQQGQYISLITTGLNYRDVLINWLISALVRVKTPLMNVIVLCPNKELWQFMDKKGIVSLYIPPESIVDQTRTDAILRDVEIIRVTVMRLLNHWGFDVVIYDGDAIILKNPEPVYSRYWDSDVVGTFGGTWPQALYKRWGVVVCHGTVVFRSTTCTEQLWNAISEVMNRRRISRKLNSPDDQLVLNYALDEMGIRWTKTNRGNDPLGTEWHGRGPSGLKVTLLPQRIACRHSNCQVKRRRQYYTWHRGSKGALMKNGRHNWMVKTAKLDGVWFLKNNWLSISQNTTLSGMEWLKSVSILEH